MKTDREFVLGLERWLDAREGPASAGRLSEEVLATVAMTPQEGRLIGRLRRPIGRKPLRLLALAATLLLAIGGLTAMLSGGRQAIVNVPSPTPIPTPTPNRYAAVARQIMLERQSWQVLATPSRVWVQTDDVGLTGVDPTTGEVSGAIADATWMFVEGDDMWVQLGPEGVLLRVDPATGLERERFENIKGFHVAKDGDTIWSSANGQVLRTDLSTGRQLAAIDVPDSPRQIVLAAGSVWVISDEGNALVRIDPQTNEVTETIDVGIGPVELELGFGSLWVRNRDREVVRVDPETATVLATVEGFGLSPSQGLSIGGGYVWASITDRPGIGAIDPITNEIVRRIPLPGATFWDFSWLDDTLWVTTAFDRVLLEVDVGSP